jgi:transposase
MVLDVATLPEDPKLLKDVIKTLLEDNQRLEERLHVLERSLFGKKSERIVSEQMLVPFGDLPVPPPPPPDPPPAPPSSPPGEKKGHGRKPLPAHLRRKRTTYDVPEGERRCKVCQAALIKIAEQIVERLEREPATFIVEQIAKAVYACTKCHGCVIVAEAPSGPIEKGLGGAGAIAHVVVGKYADHLPLERQSEMYAREGVDLSPSTLGEWIGVAADLLTPIRDVMAEEILRSRKLHFDETTLRIMEPGRGETRRGSISVYIGDDEHPHVVYRFSPNESKSVVYEVLDRYRGYVHADAAPGYDKLYKSKERIEVACWAHTRRKFFEAISTEPVIGRAAIAWIGRLYEVENTVRGRSPAEIKDARQERARPVLVEVEPWLR